MLAPAPDRVVHKFHAYCGEITIGMPAKFLAIQVQRGEPQFWVEHCPDSKVQAKAKIRVFCTGEKVEEGYSYLGTYQANDGDFIGHVYAKAEKK